MKENPLFPLSEVGGENALSTTKLSKRHAGVLVAGLLTLSIAILVALLSGWAEAQEVDSYTVSRLETAQIANSQTNPPLQRTRRHSSSRPPTSSQRP